MNIPAARVFFSEDDRKLILERVDEVLRSGMLTLGKFGRQFEEEFARRVNIRYAVAVNSGTSALEIPLRAWGIEGHSVIVPTNTFMATALAVWHAGGEVIFADSDESLCLDADSLERSIRPDTKAVIVVHIGGVVAPQIERIVEICRRRNLLLLEDAAHAHGSTLNEKHAGTFGDAATFSFYPTKLMTSGEGGMLVTNDQGLSERAQVFRDQGKAGFLGNVHTELGYNWRMSEVHAAIGLTHLARLDRFIQGRQRIARIYDQALMDMPHMERVVIPEGSVSNYYKYVAVLEDGIDRAGLKKRLKEKFGVSLSGEVYELPLHLQPVVEKMQGPGQGKFPLAEDLCRRHICLPVYPEMTDAEALYVVDSLRK
ncbi:MAG: DegT/DnrJ/EryC1/StrS family aminotransferase, partial [Chloroflexi bacterium]|nr:DegT/DnrJ/EryC1/StrS family aminotransferase [Chloroflexota bacterium]